MKEIPWFVAFVMLILWEVWLLAARIRELLENVGLAQESLPSSIVGSAQVLANVANLLNIRDTELSRWVFHEINDFLYVFNLLLLLLWDASLECVYCSFLVGRGDLSLRKSGVEEKRAKVQKESKVLLDYTRKAIARLTYLKRYAAGDIFQKCQEIVLD